MTVQSVTSTQLEQNAREHRKESGNKEQENTEKQKRKWTGSWSQSPEIPQQGNRKVDLGSQSPEIPEQGNGQESESWSQSPEIPKQGNRKVDPGVNLLRFQRREIGKWILKLIS